MRVHFLSGQPLNNNLFVFPISADSSTFSTNLIFQDFRNNPKMFEKVKASHDIICRKQNLEKRRSTIKAKMAQGTPYKNTTTTQTPHKNATLMQTPYKSHTPYKPRKQSEWAMWQEYVNRVQEPLQAVRSLLKTLE